MLNLLADDLFTLPSGAAKTLPGLFALLMADEVDALPALRPHQKQAVHCFLAQTGAMAMLAAGESDPPRQPQRWAELLRDLTPGFLNDEPWCLIVDDLSKPTAGSQI